MCDNVLFDMPVSLLAPSLFDNGANSASFTGSSSRTFKITCAVTRQARIQKILSEGV